MDSSEPHSSNSAQIESATPITSPLHSSLPLPRSQLIHVDQSDDINPITPGNNKKTRQTEELFHHHDSCCHYPTQCERFSSPLLIKQTQLHRLLYTNPVCLLTSVATPLPFVIPASPFIHNPLSQHPNVMTISWITPTDNNGNFFASMKFDRFSAQNMKATKRFVLNIPVAGMEPLVKDIGKCSGSVHVSSSLQTPTDVIIPIDEITSSNNNINNPISQTMSDATMPTSLIKTSISKFQQLNISTSSIGWKTHPFLSLSSTLDCTTFPTRFPQQHPLTSSPSSLQDILPPELYQLYYNHALQLIKRYQGPKQPDIPEVKELLDNIILSLYYGDIALPDCVAHIVCEVMGYIQPQPYPDPKKGVAANEYNVDANCASDGMIVGQIGTPGHYSIFGKMKLAWVRKSYWHKGLFQPQFIKSQSTTLPPCLTFLSQGEFLYSTRPELYQSQSNLSNSSR